MRGHHTQPERLWKGQHWKEVAPPWACCREKQRVHKQREDLSAAWQPSEAFRRETTASARMLWKVLKSLTSELVRATVLRKNHLRSRSLLGGLHGPGFIKGAHKASESGSGAPNHQRK